MLFHFLKTSFRFMLRHKGYSLLNVISLALGLGCAVLIMAYVRHELSYDSHHMKADRLYRVATKTQSTSYPQGIAKVTGPWGLAIRNEIPEVEEMSRFVFSGSLLMNVGERRLYEPNGWYADSGALKMFSWPLLRGNAATALVEPNTIVLTQGMAERYFGTDDPLGRTMTLENTIPLRITGVTENVPRTSHFTFDYLLSMGTLRHPDRDHWVRWNQFYTYVLLHEGADPDQVASKIPTLLVNAMGEQGEIYTPFLQPVRSIHLHSSLFREMEPNADITYVYIMISVAVFVLLIGCMNFMNIATARASVRAKEVGVRKASGADRMAISRQFFGESMLLSLLSLPIAAGLVELTLPVFNRLSDRQIDIAWFTDVSFTGSMVGLAVVTGLLAGIYPSLVLSSFSPVDIMKGSASGVRGAAFRKTLVVVQFLLSSFFLVATGVALDQLRYIQERRLGFNKQDLLIVPMTDNSLADRSEPIKQELLSHPAIVGVSATANLPGGGDYGIPAVPVGVPPDQAPPLRILVGDHDLLEVLQVELAEGRRLSRELASDSTSTYLINEEAARRLGWSDPLEHMIAMPAVGRTAGPVVGVMKDFHFRSMREQIMPIMYYVPPVNWLNSFAIRVAPGRTEEAIAFLESKFTGYDPLHPFRYTYFDEQFDQLHTAERRTTDLLTFVSVIAIGLACLGLFGLSAYSAERRTKEIGVRKVLGASLPGLLGLLAGEFMKLVLISTLLAWGAAFALMSLWLEQFAYRTQLEMMTFLAAGGTAAMVALATVSVQALRAALADPVSSLRYE